MLRYPYMNWMKEPRGTPISLTPSQDFVWWSHRRNLKRLCKKILSSSHQPGSPRQRNPISVRLKKPLSSTKRFPNCLLCAFRCTRVQTLFAGSMSHPHTNYSDLQLFCTRVQSPPLSVTLVEEAGNKIQIGPKRLQKLLTSN